MSKVFILSLINSESNNDIDKAIVGIFDSFDKAEKGAKVISKVLKDLAEKLVVDLKENDGLGIEDILAKNNIGILLEYNAIEIHEMGLNSVDSNFFPDQDALNELVNSLG